MLNAANKLTDPAEREKALAAARAAAPPGPRLNITVDADGNP